MIVILSGPGGVGKGTLVRRLLEISPDLRVSRSWTTRPRRPEEPEDTYVFVDRATFEAHAGAGGFLEWTAFTGTGSLYGTPALTASLPGQVVMLEIELDGAQQVKKVEPESILILVVPPSMEALEARLRGRGDNDASVARRLEVGRQEIELGHRLADHIVVNDDIDRAAAEVAGIIDAHLSGRAGGSTE